MTARDPDAPRPTCLRCLRPADLCLCDAIPAVDNRTGVYILQHAREARHPVGTVRIAELGLARIEVRVQRPDAAPVDVDRWLPPDTALLYPSDGALELATLTPGARPRNLLLIDGTWNQAKVLHRDLCALHALPHVKIDPAQPGRYQVRREPRRDYLATLEALVAALRILEPDTDGLDGLEGAFHQMVASQSERAQAGNRRKKTRFPQRESRAIPDVLLRQPERVVLAHGELGRRPDGEPVLLQWAACRLTDEATFDALILTDAATLPGPRLSHMGLSAADFATGLSMDELPARWAAFLRPDDVVCVWNAHTRDAFTQVLGAVPGAPSLVLKTAFCNLRHRAAGELDALVEREGLDVTRAPAAGRAGLRLGQLREVARLVSALGRKALER